MTDELIIRCCAPTLAAIKTGSLFNCAFASKNEMLCELRRINLCLSFSGISAIPFKFENGKALIYMFRVDMLKRDLNKPKAKEILAKCGYPMDGDVYALVTRLGKRLNECRAFPHEAGLFLGYPAEDVEGFMLKKECKYTGLWKVYESDVSEAEKLFKRCKYCTEAYLNRMKQGWTLPRLALKPRRISSYQHI